MLRIKLVENFRHRNETTFRSYLNAADYFRDIGIEFIFEGNNYDLSWVGQASVCDKNHPLARAKRRGKWFIDSNVTGDFILFDGQDSASMICSYDVLQSTPAKLLLKNTLYRDRSDYTRPSIHGRTYWGNGEQYKGRTYTSEITTAQHFGIVHTAKDYDYSIDALDLTRVRLSGTNWLSTLSPHWYERGALQKEIDVFAMFAYPGKYNEEFCRPTNSFYDAHRQRCIDWIDQLPKSIKVAKLDAGKKVPIEVYYDLMKKSKIVVAPFGYGEMAPRDLESCMVQAILIKPDMGHLESIPNPYIPEVTYRPVKWDFSDLNDVIIDTLDNYDAYREKFVTAMRNEYISQYSTTKLVTYMHGIISELPGFGTV